VKSGEALGATRLRSSKLALTLAALGLAVVAAVAVAVERHGRHTYAWPKPVPISSLVPKADFPAPPQGAVVFSRRLGSDGLALGVVPRGREVVLQASVVGEQGEGVAGLDIAFSAGAASANAETCGAGCYRARIPTASATSGVTVEIRGGPNATRWHVALPAWPPRDATQLVLQAGRVWRSLHSLSFHEELASGPQRGVTSTWRIEAPGKVAYTVGGDGAGIVIGAHRWDRQPGSTVWVESPQTPLTQPVPAWGLIADAHVLGTTTFAGRPAWRISFFDPATPSWFELTLDRQSLRTLETRMVATAHFMHDTYGAFDTTPPIVPPR
jgi:hypothetical protein